MTTPALANALTILLGGLQPACPLDHVADAVDVVAPYYALDADGALVVRGKVVGRTVEALDHDRQTFDILGSGNDLPYPTDRFIKELAFAIPGLRWAGLEVLQGPVV
jgi:hypothetical protein